MTDPRLELNIALVPEPLLSNALVKLSRSMAGRYTSIVTLEQPVKLALVPHLTLYQVPISVQKIADLDSCLAAIANDHTSQQVISTGYAYNEEECSLEVRYEISESLISLQSEVIRQVNPLRDSLLLERDPGGHIVQELVSLQDILGQNIRDTGYGEVGALFRPHATLNWFELGTKINVTTEAFPPLAAMNGTYSKLGVYILGPHGTCPQLFLEHDLVKR